MSIFNYNKSKLLKIQCWHCKIFKDSFNLKTQGNNKMNLSELTFGAASGAYWPEPFSSVFKI